MAEGLCQVADNRPFEDAKKVKSLADRKLEPPPGEGYGRARWQIDAHGFHRSSGDRLLTPDDLSGLEADQIFPKWKAFSQATVYDYEHHVAISESLDRRGHLPKKFMLLPPHSWHQLVWTDVTRMRTLNGAQHAAGRELHICPLQFDVADRAIRRLSMPGELVFDPFAGLGTIPYRAIKLGRRGLGVDLSADYWRDAIIFCEAAERQAAVPSLFDLLASENAIEEA